MRVRADMDDVVLGRRPTVRMAAPFAVIAAVGALSVLVPAFDVTDWRQVLLVTLVLANPLVLLAVTRRSSRTWLDPVPAYLMFGVVALARDIAGGSDAGISSLVGLPLLWLALTGVRRDLVVGCLLTAAVFVLPTLVIGAPAYDPPEEWPRAVLWTLFAALAAPVVQHLVDRLSSAQANWRVLLDHLPDMTVLVVDEHERVSLATGSGARRHGLDRAEGQTLAAAGDPGTADALRPLVADAVEGEVGSTELQSPVGALHEVLVSPLPADGGPRKALVVARDVSAARQRELALVDATTWVERMFADAPHGVAVLDPEGVTWRANSSLLAMLGKVASDVERRPLSALAAREDEVEEHLARVRHARGNTVEDDTALRDRDGNDVHVVLSSRMMRREDGADDVIQVNVVDVSERRRYEARLAHLADHDVLTGLPNRRRFDGELARHLDHCDRHGVDGAVLLLDLDHFKQVNDALGHNAGDQLLISTAGILRRGIRSGDVVARLGGDEFGVLLRHADCEAAEAVARSVVQQVDEFTATLDGVRRRVTASIGVVTFEAARRREEDVLALADMTMYDAKEAGRNGIAVLEEGSTRLPRSGARLQWQERIETALEEDGFALLFQPVLHLESGSVTSAEALLRLRVGDQLVPPSRFLYVAERSGLMPRLDTWVVRHAVPVVSRLQQVVPGFGLSVNLSGHSVGDRDVERAIVEALADNTVDPDTLVLEITETAAVADVVVAREFAERMARHGCRLALDDFGAGFGSFYYLKHLLFDYVKIDGEFVQAARSSAIDCAIVRSIVGIAHDLGKQTVAEFVSDEATLETVRAEGVDFAQGYLVGEPMPEADLAALLHSRGGHSLDF